MIGASLREPGWGARATLVRVDAYRRAYKQENTSGALLRAVVGIGTATLMGFRAHSLLESFCGGVVECVAT
jgi:hypothetical protein